MVASIWYADGGISAFDVATKSLKAEKVLLIATGAPSSGVIDAQAITRDQYPVSGRLTRIDSKARIRVHYDDWYYVKTSSAGYGGSASHNVYGFAYVVPSGAVVGSPTVAQIVVAAQAGSGHIFASSNIVATAPAVGGTVDVTFSINGPDQTLMSANGKYWIAVLPVQWNPATPKADAKPLYSAQSTPSRGGRGVSFWTNRTPGQPTASLTGGNDQIVASNTTLTFNLSSATNDPDNIFSSSHDVIAADLAGVHVQYAPRGSGSWIDLPFADYGSGTLRSRGWWIASSNQVDNGFEGPALLTANGNVQIKCGSNTPDAGAGLLPTGSWQIRARTFDWGHPYPRPTLDNSVTPLGDYGVGGAYSPANYPAVNTSPWSDPVFVTVQAQVPAPLPTWPVGNIAIPEGTPVTLTWEYRNTAAPPGRTALTSALSPGTRTSIVVNPIPVGYPNGTRLKMSDGQIVTMTAANSAGGTLLFITSYTNSTTLAAGAAVIPQPFKQALRWVDIRKVGDASWTNLVVSESSESTSLTVNTGTFPLVSGNMYEWRVMVRDSDGSNSTWSQPGRFWMVPAPGTGEMRPLPSETIDGATLGCGTHTVEVFRRGGKERVGVIKNISYLDWNRVRDDISTSKVVVSGWDVDCGNLLAQLQCWAYEIRITRNNGYSQDKVWEGPITLLTYEADKVTINAKDVMGYAYRRIVKVKMNSNGTVAVTSRAASVLQNVFAPDDPNVLPYLSVLVREDDPKPIRGLPPYSRTGFEEVDDLAANAGLDYTVAGRSIILWSTRHRIGTLPEFRDNDLGSTPIVSEYGMSMANVYAVSDGNGVWGEATRLNENDEDPTYGLIEMLSSSWASDSEPESGTYDQAKVEKAKQTLSEMAERSIGDRYPPPVVVRVPDNTTLNPDAVVSIQHLIPGVAIPLRSTGTLRTVVATQKLDQVKVVEQGGQETITITMSPFSRDDAVAIEGDS